MLLLLFILLESNLPNLRFVTEAMVQEIIFRAKSSLRESSSTPSLHNDRRLKRRMKLYSQLVLCNHETPRNIWEQRCKVPFSAWHERRREPFQGRRESSRLRICRVSFEAVEGFPAEPFLPDEEMLRRPADV